MIHTIDEFRNMLHSYDTQDITLIIQAAERSRKIHEGQLRASGDPYFVHPLQVSEILVTMRLDPHTIIAGLLHDSLEDTEYSRESLIEEFGKSVFSLVEGVTKIDMVRSKNRTAIQAETIRKMLFATVKDIRVILIKLADKLHNMRTLEFKKPERIQSIAQECLEIYAPLADRLGISWMKYELEDLCLKHLHPTIYNRLKKYVNKKEIDRKEYLSKITSEITKAAETENIATSTITRTKHFYSIYSKMAQRGKKLEEIYDILGVRIICGSIPDCYVMLGLVHRLWMPIEGRFKDYIAMPKANRYQSLHTIIMGYNGQLLEVQIRTKDMDQTAQYGIAAHWKYKEFTRNKKIGHDDLIFMHHIKGLDSIKGPNFLNEIKREILEDSIYVFTPKGDIIQLPRGATALDFAYHIHTEIGNRTSGAKADGLIIPLRKPLENTQVVEIITHPKAHPRLNWLRIVKTSGARSKIRAWINKHDEHVFIEQNIVARYKNPPPQKKKHEHIQLLKTDRVGIRVEKEDNVLIHFAHCCDPKAGDDIAGYISRGRGILIHRKDCNNFLNLKDLEERSIEVEWETFSPKTMYRFRVTARNTSDLFSEIEGAIRKTQGHLIDGRVEHSESSAHQNLEGSFTVELDKNEDITRVMKKIRAIPNIFSIGRIPDRD